MAPVSIGAGAPAPSSRCPSLSLFLSLSLALLLAACSAPFQTAPLPPSPTTRQFADLEGFRLHYEARGQGPTVVFLHGFTSMLNVWDDTVADLSRTHRCVVVDLPGHGYSDRRAADYTPEGVARKVLALLDTLGERRFTVVGHSWGASVALAAALAAPDRVDRVVVVDGWTFDDQANLFMRWARAPEFGDGLWHTYWDQQVELRYGMAFQDPERWYDERVIDGVKRILALPGTEAATLAIVRGLAALEGQEARYGEVTAPALLVWCRDDRVAGFRFGERLQARLPGARLEALPDCNHMPMVEQAAKFRAVLRAYLEAPDAVVRTPGKAVAP